jgi:Dolichyl-phosphate-mannose-protein mannosyltransferase
MTIASFRDSGPALVGRLIDVLGDERRAHRTAIGLLAFYALLWWAYAVVAKSTQDIHFDMGELFSWSTELAYGYAKHPPFAAWVVAPWFAIFPRTDWAYYLLAVINITIALWFMWLIAARFVEGDKRAVALVLLAFSPAFTFPPGLVVRRRAAAAVLVAAYAVPLVALAASPFVALRVINNGVENLQAHYSLVAHEIDRRWPQVSHEPLRYVAGPEGLAWGCTFYCRDRPRAFPSFSRVYAPWIDPLTMAREGFAALCLADDVYCLVEGRAIAAGNRLAREESVELARTAFGRSGQARRFTILLSPPSR